MDKEALRFIKDFRAYDERGWDTYEAEIVYPAAFFLAVGLVEYYDLKPERIIGSGDGCAYIHFSVDNTTEHATVASIEVYPDGRVEFFEMVNGEVCFTNAIPENYLNLGTEILSVEAEDYIRSFPRREFYTT